jgi:16S rRNA (cytosine1402-N4)-methyltransferase
MRFDLSQRVTARFILEHKTEGELAKIFLDYGEEKLAKKIAKAIVAHRQSKSIKTTTDLSDLLKTTLKFLPPLKIKDVIRRIFQALRIAVNLELENLENFLPKAFDILKPGGVLVVVSFHSLEDRIVKQFFKGLTKGCACPIEFPVCVCGKNPRGKILTNKPVVATQEELNNNPRSKPAKLRAIKKL